VGVKKSKKGGEDRAEKDLALRASFLSEKQTIRQRNYYNMGTGGGGSLRRRKTLRIVTPFKRRPRSLVQMPVSQSARQGVVREGHKKTIGPGGCGQKWRKKIREADHREEKQRGCGIYGEKT